MLYLPFPCGSPQPRSITGKLMPRYFLSKAFVLSSLKRLKNQWSLWIAVLDSPLEVVSENDLDSRAAVSRATGFFLFIYTVVLLLRIPLFDVFLGLDMHAPLNLLALLVLNAVSIAVFVLVFLGCTKILLGRGSLRSTAVTGIYLTAFWPVFLLTSYLSGMRLQLHASLTGRVSGWAFMEPVTGLVAVAMLLFLFFYLIVKSVPAVKYVQRIGNIRAIVICGFGYALAFEVQNWLVLKLLFEFMRLTG